MKLSSYKIFSVFGIDVELHWSFILFILGILILDPTFFLILVILFVFVTAHEICHSIVSLRNDIKVDKIMLLPIGGVAMMDISDMDPWLEFKMAIAGPVFNFSMAGLFFLLSYIIGLPLWKWVNIFFSDPDAFTLPLIHLLIFYSFYANLILGIFNLFVPAFPLDGGRVFRALLAFKYPYLKATEMAKYLGFLIAGIMFFIGITGLLTGAGGGIWIMIIAMFIGLGASSEYKGLVSKTILSQIKVEEVITRIFPTANKEESVETAVRRMMSLQKSNLLIYGEELHLIDKSKLKQISRDKWPITKVEEITKPVKTFTLESNLRDIHRYMLQEGIQLVPITKNKKLIGVVYYSSLNRVIEISKNTGYIEDKKRKPIRKAQRKKEIKKDN
ncbi:MAG: site-2 protease family protein [archaeon]